MINVPDDDGKVALMYAAEYGQKEIVKKLDYGARKNIKCKDCYGEDANWTAADYAKQSNLNL